VSEFQLRIVIEKNFGKSQRHAPEYETSETHRCDRAEYGEELSQRLAQDLIARFGRGFSYPNVNKFRLSGNSLDSVNGITFWNEESVNDFNPPF